MFYVAKKNENPMNNIFRALIAGYGAKKLGGGCLGTVLVFIVIWVALGQCSWSRIKDSAPETTEIRLNQVVQECSYEPTMATMVLQPTF
jgi:hypothetical protein